MVGKIVLAIVKFLKARPEVAEGLYDLFKAIHDARTAKK